MIPCLTHGDSDESDLKDEFVYKSAYDKSTVVVAETMFW